MACAPYRIERDGRLEAESRLTAIEETKSHPKPRGLSEEQKAYLADAIRSSGVRPEKMNVVFWQDSECADFAQDIGDAISASEITCDVHEGNMYDHNVRDRGVKIYRGSSRTINKLADSIHEALASMGFPAERREWKEKDDNDRSNTIFLYVARPSEAH